MVKLADLGLKNWAEVVALGVLVIGFLLAISMNNPIFVYIVSLIAGLMAGRYYFSKIGRLPLFPFFLIIIGFLFGYLIGAVAANRKIVALLFFVGWIVSHIAHKKKYIPL